MCSYPLTYGILKNKNLKYVLALDIPEWDNGHLSQCWSVKGKNTGFRLIKFLITDYNFIFLGLFMTTSISLFVVYVLMAIFSSMKIVFHISIMLQTKQSLGNFFTEWGFGDQKLLTDAYKFQWIAFTLEVSYACVCCFKEISVPVSCIVYIVIHYACQCNMKI